MNRAKRNLSTDKNIKLLRRFAPTMLEAKSKVVRGGTCIDLIQAMQSYKRDQIDRQVQMVNMFSRQISLTVRKQCWKENKINCQKIKRKLYPNDTFCSSRIKQTVQRRTLNAINDHAIEFLIERDYHSDSYVDLDMYYTLTTVIAPEGISPEDVIYNFVFPTYGIKIPLRSADPLMFNPSGVHACSNPKYEGCYIMSAYVSTKTVLTSTEI